MSAMGRLIGGAFLVSVLLGTSGVAQAATDAGSLLLRVGGVYASTSAICDSPVTIFEDPDSSINDWPLWDFLDNPVLGSGDIPDGTYRCIIVKMSDNIQFTALAATTNCSAGVLNTADVCRQGDTYHSKIDGSTTANCTGTSQVGSGVSPDPVFVYITTNTNAGDNNGSAFLKPDSTSSTRGIRLQNPWVVEGSKVGTLVVDARGKVDSEGGNTCGMAPPDFSFR